jgi:hypothetical protein
MAKKSGNLLIKLVVLLAVAGAVFFALDSWRKKSGDSDALVPETATSEGTRPADSTMSREEAERIGTEIGTRIGTEIGTQIGQEVAAQMLAERQAQRATGKPAADTAATASPPPSAPPPAPAPDATAEVAPESSVVASAEPEPADETVETAPAKPVTSAPREERTQGTIPAIPAVAQPSAGRDSWWTKSNTGAPDALFLTYAGNFTSADGSLKGIALMFSGRFDKQTDFASSISVTGNSPVSGKWQLGVNPGLIFLPGVPSGDYTVTIKAGLADIEGKSVKSDISGPVNVQ